ncbi:hypothetical protein THAOC_17766, partial [Thalassiosira oceanica]
AVEKHREHGWPPHLPSQHPIDQLKSERSSTLAHSKSHVLMEPWTLTGPHRHNWLNADEQGVDARRHVAFRSGSPKTSEREEAVRIRPHKSNFPLSIFSRERSPTSTGGPRACYRRRGKVSDGGSSVVADPEFECLRDLLDVPLTTLGQQEHAGPVERKVRLVKERMRALRATMPFRALPRVIIAELYRFVKMWLNAVPSRSGVSRVFSPRQIVTGTKLDGSKHAPAMFGERCEVFDSPDPSNRTDVARTTPAIFLGSSGNASGTCRFMSLETGRLLVRHQFRRVPLSSLDIARVHALAKDEPEGLSIEHRSLASPEDDDSSDTASPGSAGVDGGDSPNSDIIDPPGIPTSPDDILEDDDEGLPIDDEDDEPDEEPEQSDEGEEEDDTDGGDAAADDEEGDGDAAADDDEEDGADDGDDEDEGGGAPDDPADGEHEDVTEKAGVDATEKAGVDPPIKQAELEESDETDGTPLLEQPLIVEGRRSTRPPELVREDLERGNEMTLHTMAGPPINIQPKAVPERGSVPLPHHAGIVERATSYMTQHDRLCEEEYGQACLLTIQEDGPISADAAAEVVHYVFQQMSFKKGLKEFGADAEVAVEKELSQLHMREAFAPVHAESLSPEERGRAIESIMTVKKKRDGSIKGRQCADGRMEEKAPKEETTSPTVCLDSILLMSTISAKEGRVNAAVDLPGAYLSASRDGEKTLHMTLRGRIAELMVAAAPEVYRDYVTVDRQGRKILYVELKKALYGLVKSALLFYRKLWGDLASQGFEINPYDPCVANKTINGHQMTVCWYVDDLYMSHMDRGAIEDFVRWLERTYGKLQVKIGDELEYLGMDLKFGDGKVQLSMEKFTRDTIEEFPEPTETTAEDPAGPNLFETREPSEKNPLLNEDQAQIFHRITAKLLFLCARPRRDIRTAVAFLTTRVRAPTQDDWGKLRRVIRYLARNPDLALTLEADDLQVVTWWVDASFAVHKDMRGHTGGTMSLGKGSVIDLSRKQRFNTRSSTEAELIGVDDCIVKMEWVKHFLGAQGYSTTACLNQDNMSAEKLIVNGKRSSTQRTRHLDIKYFYVTDQVNKGWLTVQYCHTGDMLADIFTKPLNGAPFRKLRAAIMNCPVDLAPSNPALRRASPPEGPQECVGRNAGDMTTTKTKKVTWAQIVARGLP